MNLSDVQVRKYLYTVIVALLAIFVGFKVVAPEDVQNWLNLAAAVLGLVGTGIAGAALAKQDKDGKL